MEFKDFISQKRKAAGLTQEDFADKILVTRNTVQNWENGRACPKKYLWDQIMDILKIPKPEFLSYIYGNIKDNHTDLPEELFDPEKFKRVKKLVFTPEEHKYFGIKVFSISIEKFNFDTFDPYQYMEVQRNIEEKSSGFEDFIINCIMEDTTHSVFDINKCSSVQIGILLKKYKCSGKKYLLLELLDDLISHENRINCEDIFPGKKVDFTENENHAKFFTVINENKSNIWQINFPEYIKYEDGFLTSSSAGKLFYDKYKEYLYKEV